MIYNHLRPKLQEAAYPILRYFGLSTNTDKSASIKKIVAMDGVSISISPICCNDPAYIAQTKRLSSDRAFLLSVVGPDFVEGITVFDATLENGSIPNDAKLPVEIMADITGIIPENKVAVLHWNCRLDSFDVLSCTVQYGTVKYVFNG